MVLPIELAPVLSRCGLAVRRTEPSIGILPAGAHLRSSTLDYPIVRKAIDLVREAAEDVDVVGSAIPTLYPGGDENSFSR